MVQNCNFFKHLIYVSVNLKHTYIKKDIIFRMMNIDPCISRIDKILSKFCPKFLDLYARIYGNFFDQTYFVCNAKEQS